MLNLLRNDIASKKSKSKKKNGSIFTFWNELTLTMLLKDLNLKFYVPRKLNRSVTNQVNQQPRSVESSYKMEPFNISLLHITSQVAELFRINSLRNRIQPLAKWFSFLE